MGLLSSHASHARSAWNVPAPIFKETSITSPRAPEARTCSWPRGPPRSPSVQVSPPGMQLLSHQVASGPNTWPPIFSPSRPFHSMVKIQPLASPVTAHPRHLRVRTHSWQRPFTLQPRQRPHPLKPPTTAPRPQRARVTFSVAQVRGYNPSAPCALTPFVQNPAVDVSLRLQLNVAGQRHRPC